MADEFEDKLRRLAEIVDELTRVPVDDFPTRNRLMTERDRLRDQLADLRGTSDPDADRPTEDLERELDGLVASAKALRNQLIDPVVQAGGAAGATGQMGNLGSTQLNARMSESTGLAAIEARIRRLRSILADRR